MLATDRFSGFLGDGRGTGSPASPPATSLQPPSRVLLVEDLGGPWLARVVRDDADWVLLNRSALKLDLSTHRDEVIENLGTLLLQLVDRDPAMTDAELDLRAAEALQAFWSLAASRRTPWPGRALTPR